MLSTPTPGVAQPLGRRAKIAGIVLQVPYLRVLLELLRNYRHDSADMALRIINATISAIGSVKIIDGGVDPSHTVAIQCRIGRSIGKFFILHGPWQLQDRYEGMRIAFGEQQELYRAALVGGIVVVPPLNNDQFDALVESARTKQEHTAQGRSPNRSLHTGEQLPLWKWSFERYGGTTTVIFGFLALGLFPMVSGIRWWLTSQFPWEFLIIMAVILVEEALLSALLDVSVREVCYIRVGSRNVSVAMLEVWQTLLADGRCTEAVPATSFQAMEDLKQGQVRKSRLQPNGTEYSLAIPVIAVKPLLEQETARLWELVSILRPLLYPLLTAVLAASSWASSIPIHISALYVLVGWIQVNLQRLYAKAYVVNGQTQNVLWFRRLPGHTYLEELGNFRRDLS